MRREEGGPCGIIQEVKLGELFELSGRKTRKKNRRKSTYEREKARILRKGKQKTLDDEAGRQSE